MNPTVEINLALILFLPWYAILAWAFWAYPRQPRNSARRLFDLAALLATTLLSVMAMRWGFLAADGGYGPMWKQVLATSVSYGAFLAALTAAFFLRRQFILRPERVQ